MPKFKVSVSKNQKKYSIVLTALSETEARKKVHAEGYSILGVQEFSEQAITGHKFFFEAVDKKGVTKKGKVVAADPFKVYVKLREGLGYTINFLYSESNKDLSEGEKMDLVTHLEEQYSLYSSHTNKNKSDEVKRRDTKKEKKNLENFYLKKELDETYRLIDFVLIKLKNILDKAEENEVNTEKKEKLQKLYNSITKIKKTTNVTKLREIGELGLKKIGQIELNILEKYKDDNSKKLLTETNSLLKKLGSKEHFIEKDKDIGYLTQKFIGKVSDKLKSFKIEKKQTQEGIDKESASYWKTELLINKYESKRKDNTIKIIKKIYIFLYPFGKNKEEVNELLIRRKIINQNITILKAKKTGKLVSYTKLVKGYNNLIALFVLFLKLVNNYIFFIVYFFSVLFLFYIIGIKVGFISLSLNVNGIFIFLYLIIGSILIFATRGVFTLGINIALLIFLFIFGVVNF